MSDEIAKYLVENDLEEVKSYRRKRKKLYPSFSMFCNGEYNKNYKEKSMDAMEYLLDLNPKSKERKALQYLVDNRNKSDNVVMIELSAYDKKSFFYDGVKKLIEDKIAKKIMNGVYMVSPFFIVPYNMDDELKKRWEK